MPGIQTTYSQIKRLLPSQKYNYKTGEVSIRPLMLRYHHCDNNLAEFEKLFFNGIEEMYKYYDGYKMWLPISGGKDSRVCLAAFEKLKKNYAVYVFQNKEAKYAGCYQDLGVSRLLSRTIHRKLIIVYGDSKHMNEEKVTEFEKHTSGLTMMSPKWQYPCDTLKEIEKSGTHVLQIRNNIWELVCNDYDHNNVMNTPDKIRDKWRERNPVFEQSIEEWLKIVENDKVNTSISFGDRAYWDLRLGCWLADGMQGFDIFDNIETINILNCRIFISLLMELDAKVRGTRSFEVELTNKWCPAFANIPYEEDYQDITLFIRKWKGKIVRKLKKH